jgi:CBS domain containing-hemolysin-like protein
VGTLARIDVALGLLAVVLLVLANGFFVAAEFGLVAVDRDRVAALAAGGSRRARTAAATLEHLSFNLSGAQLGITVTSLVLGYVAEPTVARAFEPLLGDAVAVRIAVALALVTVVQMVVGELVPKGYAVARPMELTLALVPAIRLYGLVFGPVIRFLNGAADATVRRLGIEPREELRAVRTIDELELLIASSGEEGTLDPEAFELLTRTIRFGSKAAVDAMVPRLDMATISADATVADVARLAIETGHSRFPIVGEDLDDVRGVVHAKDVLQVAHAERERTSVLDILAPATFIPEGRDLESLLTEMRGGGVQLAVVADEYGGVAGLVTLEDLLEEIVGEIEDEHDAPVPPTTSAAPAGRVVLEGSLHLDEVTDLIGLELPEGPYETVAGYVLLRLGHLPVPGERVRLDGWELEVLEMDRRRIATIGVLRTGR